VLAALALVVLAPAAAAADRMWIGFHDDPVLRYDAGRQAELDLARSRNASILRTLVVWADVAPEKPARPTDPFDPAYRFDDLDELLRNAQLRGMEVLITLWGTPEWANDGKTKAYLPTNMKDFESFARAVASRYSGRFAGYPFVRYFGIWNESNLGTFLLPQFDATGKIVGPANYARLAQAGVKGVKAGNSRALVAIGETSSTGRDKKSKGTDSVAPATFMKGVAKANKRLKFDAWAQHPYPFPVNQKPTQKVRYPNVTLTSFPQFEKDLDAAFGRKNIPIWVTEYGNETKPGEPKGVTEAQQAAYLPQAIALAKANPRVQMFIWFVFRDSDGSLWQSGIYRQTGAAKPAAAKFAATAGPLDARNPLVTVKGGTRGPTVTAYVREFCFNNAAGAAVGASWKAYLGGKLAAVGQTQQPLGVDCTIPVKLATLTAAKGKTYTVTIDLNTANGGKLTRTATVVGS
jgi:hypothetical protein